MKSVIKNPLHREIHAYIKDVKAVPAESAVKAWSMQDLLSLKRNGYIGFDDDNKQWYAIQKG